MANEQFGFDVCFGSREDCPGGITTIGDAREVLRARKLEGERYDIIVLDVFIG